MPEFHASNTVWRTGEARPVTPPPEMSDQSKKSTCLAEWILSMFSLHTITEEYAISTMTTLQLVVDLQALACDG